MGEPKQHKSHPLLRKGETLILLTSVFVTSICALAYELIIGATGAYIAGDGVRQFAFTIGIFLSSMGFGSFISRSVPTKEALRVFVSTEVAIGFFGGLSHPILYTLYAYTNSYTSAFYGLIIVIGTLTGLEIPLVTRVLSKSSPLRLSISNVLSLDYLGALFTAVLFPLVLLPGFGLWHSSLFFGIINLILAGILIVTARRLLWGTKLVGSLLVALMVLFGAQLFGRQIMDLADAQAYGEEIVYSKTTHYQKIVMTRWRGDIRLYLNGNIQFSSYDEYRYHEALIHPLFSSLHQRERILILGGGDGLALREVFKYNDVKQVTLVDLDPAMVALARSNRHLRALNASSLHDKRVRVLNQDAWSFARESKERYSAIIVDLPDPTNEALAKLYSKQFYRMLANLLDRDGGLVVQSTSPYFNRRAYWCVVESMKTTGLNILPYHAHVPSFGEWGYAVATRFQISIDKAKIDIPTRYLTTKLLPALLYFPKDIGPVSVEVSTLDHPLILKYYDEDYTRFFGKR